MHGHSHSHSHSHYDPNRQSTLLNPVKNVELYRVSEETRQRVATDSSRIEAENKHLYEVSRKRIMRKEADRLRNNNLERQKMIDHWKAKSMNSPLHTDYLEKDNQREKVLANQQEERRIARWKQSVVDGNVPCLNKFDPVPKQKYSIFKPEVQLALELRKHANDLAKVYKAKSLVEQLQFREAQEMGRKFPALKDAFDTAQKEAAGRSGGRSESSTGDNGSRKERTCRSGVLGTGTSRGQHSTGESSHFQLQEGSGNDLFDYAPASRGKSRDNDHRQQQKQPHQRGSTTSSAPITATNGSGGGGGGGGSSSNNNTNSNIASSPSVVALPPNSAESEVMRSFEDDLDAQFGSKYVMDEAPEPKSKYVD